MILIVIKNYLNYEVILMNNISSIQNLVILILLSFIAYIFTHPDRIIEINAKISVLLAPIVKSAEKPAVKLTVESTINNISNNLNKEIEGILPYGVEIEWVRNTNRESFIKDNKVIIRMEFHNNNTRNIVHATLKYLEEGLLNNVKKSLDKKISISIDFTIAKKTLRESKKYDSLQYLMEDIINPIENDDEYIKEYLKKLNDLNEYGFFTRIFLNELKQFDTKLYGIETVGNLNYDITYFIDKLYDIANKEKGVDIDTDCITDNFKLSFVYIARADTLQRGISPYIKYINGQIKEGFDNFYLIARGKYNIGVANLISSYLIKNNMLNKIIEYEYRTNFKGRKYEIICINMKSLEDNK